MIQQTAPIVATALLQSLYAGALCYAVLRILLAALHKANPFIKYHLCNIAVIVPFIAFIVPLYDIYEVLNTAPVLPVATAIAPNIYITSLPHTSGTAHQQLPEVTALSPQQIWDSINSTIMAYSDIITWVYLCGVLLFSARLLMQYLQARRLKTQGVQPADDVWQMLLDLTKERLSITQPIKIAFTTRNISPCITGHAKAMILIPVAMSNNLTTEQCEAILLHELAHFKQYDYYINLLSQCINCLLFFNPFAWLMVRQAKTQRELSCDATASAHGRHIELAETLAIIAGMQTREHNLSLSLKQKGSLLVRVQTLLRIQPERTTPNRLIPLALITIVMAMGMLIAGSTKLFSTEKDNLKEQLQQISDKMYKEGNYRYVFVDAVIDSLITLPAKAEMVNLAGGIFYKIINNDYPIDISEKLSTKYREKLSRYLIAQGEDADAVVHFKARYDDEKLTLEDILNADSDFRKITAKDRYRANITTRAWKQIYKAMYDDGLIQQPRDRFEMRYGIKGIEVNGKKLTGVLDVKYRKMYAEILGLELNRDDVSGSMRFGDLEKYLVVDESKNSDTAWMVVDDVLINKLSDDMPQKEKYMFSEMHREGLIDTNYKVVVVFSNEGIYANYIQLKGKHADRYTEMMLPKDVDVKGIKNRMTIYSTHNMEKDFPPGLDKKAMNKELMKHVAKVMADHDKAMKQHDAAMIEHEKAMVEHDKAMEEHEIAMKQHYRAVAAIGNDYTYDMMIAMHKEGLLDTAYQVRISYNSLGDRLHVNDVRLDGTTAAKYVSIIRKNEPEIAEGKKVSFIYEKNKERNFPAKANRQSLGNRSLQDISAELYQTGYQGYVIADALLDGYIKDGRHYKVGYNKNGVFIDGVALPPYAKKIYDDKMKAFTELHKDAQKVWWSVDDTLKMSRGLNNFKHRIIKGKADDDEPNNHASKKTFKTSSVTLYSGPLVINKSKGSEKELKALVKAMEEDGLIHVNSYYVVEYLKDGIRINARPLTGSHATKYGNMLQAMGDKPGSGVIVEHVPEGVKTPDFYSGDTKIELKTNGTNLPAIAELMFTEGNPDFILAYAMHDGLLKERQRYKFYYKDGKVLWNGKTPPTPLHTKYAKLMKDFFAAHSSKTDMYSTLGNGITKKDLNNPESSVRRNRIKKGYDDNGEYYVFTVIKMMAKDGLLDTNTVHTLKYNARGIFVNGKKLTGADEAKYEPILEKGYGHKPRWVSGDELSYSSKP